MNAIAPLADQSIKILRLPQVCDLTGLGRSMIYQMEADKRFPERIKIGTSAVGWLEREVHAWLIKRIEVSRRQSPRTRTPGSRVNRKYELLLRGRHL